MRLAPLIFACCAASVASAQNGPPAWLTDGRAFCKELAMRANGTESPVPSHPALRGFSDYPASPIAPSRKGEAMLLAEDLKDDITFSAAVGEHIKEGADFAGRYALVRWSCGTGCNFTTVVDVITTKTYQPPFTGVVDCQMGRAASVDRRIGSNLLVIRGSLLMAGTYDESGPCGTFYFHWKSDHLRLIGCDVESEPVREDEANDSGPPRFEDFPVRTSLKKRQAEAFLGGPQSTGDTGLQLQARITLAAREGPDFAGRYAVIRIGCGSDCNALAIVDSQSGRRVDMPFNAATRCVPFSDGPLISYRFDSRLLIVKGSLDVADKKGSTVSTSCGTRYYVVQGNALKLIQSFVRPNSPSPQ